jgi:hypothetical protein
MLKNKKVVIILAVIVLLVIVSIFEYYDVGGFEKRITSTSLNLKIIRNTVNGFSNFVGRWPTSLSEISSYAEKHGDYAQKYPDYELLANLNEYVSSRNGKRSEHSILNGTGGWYYNPKNGEVKINVNKSLRKVCPFYFRADRNKVPSEW